MKRRRKSMGLLATSFMLGSGFILADGIFTEPLAVEAASATYTVTVSTLNVRSGAGTNYKVIGTVKKGAKLSVVKKESNGWYKINYNGKTGYVSGSYVKATTNNSSNTSIIDIVNNMKTLGNAQQLILVTAPNYSNQAVTIRTFEKTNGKWKQVHSMTGVVGKKGMTDKMSEGSQAAPTGKYTIGTAFGRGSNPGTKLPYRKITSDDVWVDDPSSSLYNTWQKASQNKGRWKSAEKMNIPQYDLGFVINYNTSNPKAGAGSAIFFHVRGNYSYTLGCTATSKNNVSAVLKWLNPDKKPVIIQTPESGLGKY